MNAPRRLGTGRACTRRAVASTRDALRALQHGRAARKLRRERARLRRHVRALLAAYSAQAPR